MRLTKRVTFADHVVNDPVAAGEFSLKKLGLKRGAVVSDERTSVQSGYEPGDFEDGGDGGEAAQGADGQRPPGRQN